MVGVLVPASERFRAGEEAGQAEMLRGDQNLGQLATQAGPEASLPGRE